MPSLATLFQPGPLMIGLNLTAPAPPGSPNGIEVAAPGYTRMLVNFLPPSDATDELANEATTEWPRATTLWGDIAFVTAYTLDGSLAGWGNVVSQADRVTPVVVRIDRGDVARFAATSVFLFNYGHAPPRPYGVGSYGSGLYSRGATAPRPYGIGRYGVGPYSRTGDLLTLCAAISEAFDPTAVLPGAFNDQCSGAPDWLVEALP